MADKRTGGEEGRDEKLLSLKSWCQRELSLLLKSTIDSYLLDYLFEIEVEKDLIEYLQEMMVSETLRTKAFVDEFIFRWKQLYIKECTTEGNRAGDLYGDHVNLYSQAQETHPKQSSPPGLKKRSDPSNSNGMMSVEGQSALTNRRSNPKQKLKFVELMTKEGQSKVAMYVPGRIPCQCLALKHSLVNNCIHCGRIVCSQEGSGPCLFCGAVVCTPEEENWMSKDSKKARMFREQFMKKHNIVDVGRPLDHFLKCDSAAEGLHQALHHRNRLLEFDQTSATCTKVIDDESDYFSVDTNRWLSSDAREALRTKEDSLREQKYGSRRTKAVTLDIAGRRVLEEDTNIDLYAEKHAKEAMSRERRGGGGGLVDVYESVVQQTHAGALFNHNITTARPQFVEKDGDEKKERLMPKSGRDCGVGKGRSRHPDRLQDRCLQEMKDEGACLSMHQPWASLLVHDIKRCEGRTWYSTHRGRLWIAATSRKPSATDILNQQQFYMKKYGGTECLYFPEEYPVSCLLGCVDVLDCLPQEDYREKFPDGESESDYVFIVDNPQQLTVKFPVKGHHKIWNLEKNVHLSAKSGLSIMADISNYKDV